MTVKTNLPHSLETNPDDVIWRLSVEQYHQMIQMGILKDGDPIELLEGLLIRKMTKNPPHILAKGLCSDVLARLLPDGWFISDQEPITTSDSEPEPDLAIIRGKRRDFTDHHPAPGDVGLVIEVSDSTLQRDQVTKQRLYAGAGIPVYWIVNLVERKLEVYTAPKIDDDSASYQNLTVYDPADQVVVVLDGSEIGTLTVRDILP